MATLDQLLREYRQTLLALDREIAQSLVAAHRAEVARLRAEFEGLMAALRSAGSIDDPARWARDTRAARVLLAAAERGMGDFGEFAAQQIDQRMQSLVRLAAEHDDSLTYASIVGPEQVTPATSAAIRSAFTAIPVEAVQNIVGALQPGSPLRELFDGFGVDSSRRLGEALVQGLTRGQGAEQIGRALRQSLDGDAARALTIARTETHRAYRTASLERYRANPRVYAGWRWHASLDRRTCPVCVAKHGSVHELDEDFGSHPNCRCRPVGVTRRLTEITGNRSLEMQQLEDRIEAARPKRDAGKRWFDKLDVDAQREILGPRKLAALREGRISLDDVVVEKVDPRWGLGHRTASLREALEHAKARGAGKPSMPPTAAADPAPRPQGIRVESLVQRSPSRKHFDEAVDVIRTVHDPDATLRFNGAKRVGSNNGVFSYHSIRDHIGDIAIKDRPEGMRTGIHEIGHALDYQLFGPPGRMGTATIRQGGPDHPQREWYDAVEASGIHALLEERFAHVPRYMRYLKRTSELWARSYEQWITLRSGNERLAAMLANDPRRYWPDDDFGPIAAAMDRIFGVTP